jgi:hypothetical protein
MKALGTKEEHLVKLAIAEGIDLIFQRLDEDFAIHPLDLTVHQGDMVNKLLGRLFIVFAGIIEDHGVLQTQYER